MKPTQNTIASNSDESLGAIGSTGTMKVQASSMNLCATGFVGAQSGSVASANAIILERLLQQHKIHFFTKPSFVDPRIDVASESQEQLHVEDCTNTWGDGLRRWTGKSRKALVEHFFNQLDSATYNRRLVRTMAAHPGGDLDLWLGDWARGRGERPVVSFAQGPPGTDADSVFQRRELIERLGGRMLWLKLAAYSRWRLRGGLPRFRNSDHVIVGSQWSRGVLINRYGMRGEQVHALPYPIDLQMFQPPKQGRDSSGRLRVLWLGRFAPRKRLDLFLDGLALAIQQGCQVEGWVVGRSGFVPGYERLIEEFPYPRHLLHMSSVPRSEVPSMLSDVDVMAQPSDDENFGSSVAEGLACGVPAIVGRTNGTGDYVCERSIRLADDTPEGFAAALKHMSELKSRGELSDPEPSRIAAEKWFRLEVVTDQLEEILRVAAGE